MSTQTFDDHAWLRKHAFEYAYRQQDMLEHEAQDYANWYVEHFPIGDVAHNNEFAFYTWIRTADTRYRHCYPSA